MAQKKFRDLTEKEILALAIASEEEDGRIYGEFAEGLVIRTPRPRRCLKKCAKKK